MKTVDFKFPLTSAFIYVVNHRFPCIRKQVKSCKFRCLEIHMKWTTNFTKVPAVNSIVLCLFNAFLRQLQKRSINYDRAIGKKKLSPTNRPREA